MDVFANPLVNSLIIAAIVSVDSYLMFRLGEWRANKYIKRMQRDPRPVIDMIKSFIRQAGNDPELANPKIVVDMTKSVMKSFKDDPEFNALMNEMAKAFANSLAEQLKSRLPEALEEARAKSPLLDSIVKLLVPQQQKKT